MDISSFSLFKANKTTQIKSFDCGDDDLNEFLIKDCINYDSQLLAVTYILESDTETVAFFSIFNDALRAEEVAFPSKTQFKAFLKSILPHPKRFLKNFPAMKIGRLAVSENFKGQGIGKLIIQHIIELAIDHNSKCACRFITVDAYAKSTWIYEKFSFEYLTEKDKNEETRQMYLDLTPYLNTLQDEAVDRDQQAQS